MCSRTCALFRFSVALVFLGADWAAAETRYVNASLTTGGDNGASWIDAYRGGDGLARALTAAVAGDEIWVAAGTYKPTLTATRTIYFNLKTGVAIYGGFFGNETSRDDRDSVANATILSGDIGNNDPVVTDNSYHVVNGAGANATAILDGFLITAGNSNGASATDTDRGGGLIFLNSSNATIRNCRITGNRVNFGGGGTYIRAASPTFVDCIWQSNTGGSFGGAIDMFSGCSPTFTRCAFIGNSATRAGGVEVFGNCQPVFVNTIFRNNAAGASSGGGLYVASTSNVTLRNCTIARNTTTTASGSGILSAGSTVSVLNSIVYSNTASGGSTASQLAGTTYTARYSCVQNGIVGVGNISDPPTFADEAAGDLRLVAGSRGIDAGQNSDAGAGNTTDFDGNPRFVDDPATADTGVGTPPIVDMGAFEFQGGVDCPTDLDNDGIVSLADLTALLASFGCTAPANCTGDLNNDGNVSLEDLAALLAAFGANCP